MVPAVLEKGADEPGVLLYYCEKQEISQEESGDFPETGSFIMRLQRNTEMLFEKESWTITGIMCREKIWMPVWK